MTPHSSSIAFLSSTSSSTVILPSSRAPSRYRLPSYSSFLRAQLVVLGVSEVARPALGASDLGVRLGGSTRSAAARAPARLAPARTRTSAMAAEASSCDVSPSPRAARCEHRSGRPGRAAARDTSRRTSSAAQTIAPTSWPRSTSTGGSFASVLDLLAPTSTALEDAAADREHLRRLAPRRASAFATATGSPSLSTNAIARRPFEQREQRVRPGGLGRPARQRVLDDREARAVRRAASCAGRRSAAFVEPAVVGDDQRLRRAQALGQLRDDSLLLGSSASSLPPEMTRPAWRRAQSASEVAFLSRLGRTSALAAAGCLSAELVVVA